MGPEIGSVHDGYRFKGGDPNAEGSWEQVAPIDVSDAYGAGARQLPNGRIERVGPRGGVTKIADAAGGGSEASPMVGADARARFMIGLGPLTEANRDLADLERDGNPLNRDWGAAAIDQMTEVPFLRNLGDSAARAIGGEDYQKYAQAAATYEASLLPIQSGAAVTPTEAARQIRADLPAWGDSPEVLERKARNREMRINAIAKGIGEDQPFAPVEINPETGLPRYDGIAALTQGVPEIPMAGGPTMPGGGQGPTAPTGPQPGDVRVTAQPLAADDTPESLRAQGYVYDAARDTWSRSRQEVVPEYTAAGAVEQRREMNPILRRVDGFVRGAADVTSAGFSDEGSAFMDAAIGRGNGQGFGDRYSNNVQTQRAVDQADARDIPVTRLAGQVVGGIAAAPALLGRGAIMTGNALRTAAGGAIAGGAYGAGSGEGSALQRVPNALLGAGIGGVAAPLATPVAGFVSRRVAQPVVEGAQSAARFVGRQAGRVGEAAGVPGAQRLTERATPNVLRQSTERMADRMGPTRVNALTGRVQEQRGLGLEPTLVDALDDGSRGRIRALATRDTPARDEVVRFAEDRRNQLPTQVRRIATDEVSGDGRPTPEVINQLTNQRRTNAAAIGGFGDDPVNLPDDAVMALRSPMVRGALQDQARRAQSSLDPEVRASANRLNQLADVAMDNPSGAMLTVREVQDISAALRASADGAFRGPSPADGPVMSALSRALRDAGRESSEGYRDWLRQYADDSSLMEAATTGRNFVSVSADPANARSTDSFIQRATEATPAELTVQRQAAGQAMQAAGSSPRSARSVLDTMASDVDAQRRASAIGVDADRLQARSRAALDGVTAAQRVSPRIGSETATNATDAAGAAGIGIDAFTRPLTTALGVVARRIQSRGFNDQEAEAIVRAAIDPSRTDEVITMLQQRMSRREARNLARVIRRQSVVTATGPEAQASS